MDDVRRVVEEERRAVVVLHEDALPVRGAGRGVANVSEAHALGRRQTWTRSAKRVSS